MAAVGARESRGLFSGIKNQRGTSLPKLCGSERFYEATNVSSLSSGVMRREF